MKAPELIASRRYSSELLAHLQEIEQVNEASLDLVAHHMLRTIEADGLIYTAGTGHSLALVMESFYRAGGLACVRPIYHASLLPLAGARYSTHSEKTSGLAQSLLERVDGARQDMAFVFSHSAANAVPVELARGLKQSGMPVVSVASTLHMTRAGKHPTVADIADYLLDTRVPYGDAAYIAQAGPATAPTSTLCAVFLWNLALSRLADLAAERNVRLPIWTSSNVTGGEERNRELFRKYSPRVPEL